MVTTNFFDEEARLQELRQYDILDTPEEQDFEDVVKLASYFCNASIGLVTFVDDCRQWFKAKIGFEARETTKDISFCAHTIHTDRFLEVMDTLQDKRFSKNPLVLEGPKVRFYAGVPLVSPAGFKLGSLCVLDQQPRKLTERQLFALEVLAKYIVQLLELRVKKQSLAVSRREHEVLQESVHRQQRALTRAQRAARIGMFEVDLENEVMKVSEGFCHLFGLKLTTEISTKEYLSIIHPDDLPDLLSYTRCCLENKEKKFTYDYRCIKKNTKKEIYVRTTGEFVRNGAGEPLMVIGIKQEITEQKWYEHQLESQNAELKKVNQELDNFVYRVSHDLRAPISSLLGLVEIISGEHEIEKVKELLLLVKKTLHKQDKFIKDILDYSRNARQVVQPELIDFEELLDDVFSQFAYASNSDKLSFTKVINLDEPFSTDFYRLRIILNNLISNAIKYQHTNREHKYVRVQVQPGYAGAAATEKKREKVPGISISIEDNGIGIGKEHQAKVFNMFYRATDHQPGSGLGLYIVRETVAKLKGEVFIESKEGTGTTITVFLPNLSA